MEFFIIVLTTVLFFALAFPVILIIHELGHAITALIMTQKPVVAFIGNPKDEVKWRFQFGRLDLQLTSNFFWTSRGYAFYSPVNLSWFKKLLIVCMGPLSVSVFFSIAAYFVGLDPELKYEGTNMLFFLLFSVALFEIYGQFTTTGYFKTTLENGMIVVNDGTEILSLFEIKDKAKEYDLGLYFIDKGDYNKALDIFNRIKNSGIDNHLIENEIIYCRQMLNVEGEMIQ